MLQHRCVTHRNPHHALPFVYKKQRIFFALVKTLSNIVMGIEFPVLTNPST